MGCDIHAHVEIKIDGQWHHYNHPSANRNYALFARMADVRNDGDIEPISQPRGIPTDATFTTRFDYDWCGADAHSASWLSAEEVVDLNLWMRDKINREYRDRSYFIEGDFGYIFGHGWYLKKCPDDYPDGVEDARLVFWFDN